MPKVERENTRDERLGSVGKSYIPSTARTTKSKKCDEHDNVCAICLEEDLNPTDETTAICLECTPGLPKHCFHKTCLTDYIKSKTLTNTLTECPICRIQISKDNLKKLNITAFVPTDDPAGQYTRANIPVPEGGFILPRLTNLISGENNQILNQLRGYNIIVYKPDGPDNKFIAEQGPPFSIDNIVVSDPSGTRDNSGTWYVGTGDFNRRFRTDYVYVAVPLPETPPGLYDSLIRIIATRYNALPPLSSCTVSGGKRRGTKRRRSTTRKDYKKRSAKRRGTRRRR